MSIVTGIQTGIQTGIRTGINGYWLPLALRLRTQAQWAAATGLTLSNLYLCEDASAQMTDEIGGVHLPEQNTPLYRQPTPWSGVVGVGFDDATSDRFNGGAVFVEATSYAYIGVSVLPASFSGGQILGKNGATVYQRVNAVSGNGYIQWIVSDGTTVYTLTVSADHRDTAFVWIVGVDRTANLAYLCTPLGQSEIDITGAGSFDSGGFFDVGSYVSGGTLAVPQTLVRFARAAGSSAELSASEQIAVVAQLNQGVS